MTLAYAGIQVELREVVLKNKPEQMLIASSTGTVPVLILPSQQVIAESIDIMNWALEFNDPDHWLCDDLELKNLALNLVARNDNEFKYYLDRYKYFERYQENNQRHYRDKAECFLTELKNLLNKNKFLLGSKITFLDVALFPFVRQFAFVDQEWFFDLELNKNNKKLIKWLNYFLANDIFLSVMKKYKPWSKENKKILFL